MDINIEQVTRFANLEQLGVPETIIAMVVGALLLMVGYRVKKVAFFVVWFIVGYNLALFLSPTITSAVPQIAENELWQMLIPIVGGLLVGLLGFTIEKICVSGISFALVMLVTVQYFGTDVQMLAIGGIIGIIAAGAAVMLMKPAIIIATSVAGAYVITMGALRLSGVDASMYYWPILLGVSVFGVVCQFLTTKRL